MGRPKDDFVRKHAGKTNEGWICRYCNRVFKTSVSRMRVHLSGAGDGNISGCENVPKEIADEALGIINTKRRRNSSEVEDNVDVSVARYRRAKLPTDPLPSSSDYRLITERATEEYVTDALLKIFFHPKKATTVFDFINDPNFREFLERVHKHGVPLSLLRGDSFIVEKSLFNIKHVVSEYLSEVMKSWKTTGCTLIGYDLTEMKVISSNPKKDKYGVLGFYSPKGFIFFEGPDLEDYDLKYHLPSLDIDKVEVRAMNHEKSDWGGGFSSCEFSDKKISRWTDVVQLPSSEYHKTCIRHEMQEICIDAYNESEWAQSLVKKAEEIHHCLVDDSLSCNEYHNALKENGFKGCAHGKHTRPLSRFLAIMLLKKDEIKQLLGFRCSWVDIQVRQQIEAENKAILDNSMFWEDSSLLNETLTTLLFKIPDVMDTLGPTNGYLRYLLRESIFKSHTSIQKVLISRLGADNTYLNVVACLNPFYYFLQADEAEKVKLKQDLRWYLPQVLRGEKIEEIGTQIGRYNFVYFSNLFPNYTDDECHYHPVKFWEEHGQELPLLQKYAIEVLSKPVSCMCNQVKKHFLQVEGAEDYILRLNISMMEEFRNLGDDIYKPLPLHISNIYV